MSTESEVSNWKYSHFLILHVFGLCLFDNYTETEKFLKCLIKLIQGENDLTLQKAPCGTLKI